MILLLATALAADCPEAPQIAYDGNTIRIAFCPDLPDCEDGCWAGATLRRASDAMHYDLEPVFVEKTTDLPIVVKGQPGPGFVQYVAGVWDDKVPCGNDRRHGCTAWGTLLENELWTWPPGAYSWFYAEFEDLTPPRVSVLEAGGGAALAGRVRTHLSETIGHRLGHRTMDVLDGGKAGHARAEVEILYRARWDRPFAWALAASMKEAELGYRWTVRHWPEAPEAFVVAVGAE